MKACVALCLALFIPSLAAEETTPLTSNQADAILKELQEIRVLLEKIEKQQRFEPVKKENWRQKPQVSRVQEDRQSGARMRRSH